MNIRPGDLRWMGSVAGVLVLLTGTTTWADVVLPGDARLRNVETLILATEPETPTVPAIQAAQASIA